MINDKIFDSSGDQEIPRKRMLEKMKEPKYFSLSEVHDKKFP